MLLNPSWITVVVIESGMVCVWIVCLDFGFEFRMRAFRQWLARVCDMLNRVAQVAPHVW